jgi:endonuclease YncB( thermonuclease family)
MRHLIVSFLLLTAHFAIAETFVGRVVSIADGDTLTILDTSNQQHRIRLNGVDAPEKAQAFGNVSKQNLARLAFGRGAVADCPKVDRYGRQVCLLRVDGIDVGLAQVEAGLTWWYRKYAKEQSPQDRATYAAVEQEA